MASKPVFLIHTDGASRGNPGAAAYGYVIEKDDEILAEEGDCLGDMTNNQAEYTALIRALEHAVELGTQHALEIRSDSELMVKQIKGIYKVKNADLQPLHATVKDLLQQFAKANLVHVRREANKRADQLCNEALDGKRESTFHVLGGNQSKPAPRKAPKPTEVENLDDAAVACLQRAAESWSQGDPTQPSSESVWEELSVLLKKHGR